MKQVEEMKFEYEFGDSNFNPNALAPRIQNILRVLSVLPDGKLLDTYKLAEMASVAVDSLKHDAHHVAFTPYKSKIRMRTIWGNEKTIKAWNERNGKA